MKPSPAPSAVRQPDETWPRIGLLGPVFPHRGGIAQHTTMLHRALIQRSDLITLSLRRPYPRFLYPGKGWCEPGYEGYREPGVRYCLDLLSPGHWIRACRLLRDHGVSMAVIPWWTVSWAPCMGFISRYLALRGVRVVFLCHNVWDHEWAGWKEALARRTLGIATDFIVHTEGEAFPLRRMIPGARILVHPHPVYSHFPIPSEPKLRRARLELLFFGFVRPYKGLDVLLGAMEQLRGEDVFLTVAGEWWIRDRVLRDRAAALPNVEILDAFLSQEEVGGVFSRCDVVVLPYRSTSGTGVIPLACHFRKAVIASDVPGIREGVTDGVTGTLVPSGSPSALSEVIRDYLRDPPVMKEAIAAACKSRTWESMARRIVELAQIPCGR